MTSRRGAPPFLQKLPEEAFGGSLIATRLDEDIDHVAVLVNRTPEILALALNRDEDLTALGRFASPLHGAKPKGGREREYFTGRCDLAVYTFNRRITGILREQRRGFDFPNRRVVVGIFRGNRHLGALNGGQQVKRSKRCRPY